MAVAPIAIYARVSSNRQDHASQLPDLERWASEQDTTIKWYRDKFTGKTMDRPGWRKLEADMRAGKISKIVVWRQDRLGRTARELLGLRDELVARKVDLVMVVGGMMGLDTPEGRLWYTMLAGFAEYDNEIRSERVKAGQAVARDKGKKWGGWTDKHTRKVTAEKRETIRHLLEQGTSKAAIARAVELSRPTVYEVIRQLNKEASSDA